MVHPIRMLPRVWVALATILAAFLMFDATSTGSARELTRPSPPWICINQRVPPGHVVTSSRPDVNCPFYSPGGHNSHFVERPGTVVHVCASSPIPEPYVIIAGSRRNQCGTDGHGNNAFTIRVPRATETVCAGSRIPRGYRVTQNVRSAQCPFYNDPANNAFVIRRN